MNPKYIETKGPLAKKRLEDFTLFRQNIIIMQASMGISAVQLSELLDIRPKRISDYHTGRCTPNFDQIRIMAKVFGVTIDQLLYKKAVITFES